MTRHLTTAARLLLGTLFFVFGLNGFLGFLPQPPVTPEGGAFLGALAASGYFFPLLKATETAVGLALLSGRLVPLALTVLAPVTIQIVAFHLFLSPDLGVPALVVALQLYLAYAYRESFRGVLQPNARPVATRTRKAAPLHPAHA